MKNKTFFETINKAYCITLEKRPEKWNAFKKDTASFLPIDVTKWFGIDGSTLNETDLAKFKFRIPKKYEDRWRGHAGCTLAHTGIYKDALIKGYDKVLIFEDDCVITNTKTFIADIERSACELPDDWLMFMLGGREWRTTDKLPLYEQFSENLARAIQVFELHAYVVTKEYMEIALTYFNKKPIQTDNISVQLQKDLRKTYITNPIYCTQRPGHSDILHRKQSTHGIKTYLQPRQLKFEDKKNKLF